MKYETKGGVVSRSETYMKLIEHLREAQDQAAMLGHLHNAESSDHDKAAARGWLMISEQMKRMVYVVTELAKGTLQ